MAQATNLTIKKADGTTDVTYSLVIASGGDKSPAIWQDMSASSIPAARSTLKVESTNNGAGTARRVDFRFEYPYAVTNPDGTVSILNRELASGSFINPKDVPDNVAAEAAAQFTNLLATTAVKQMFATGYAAT